MLYAINVNKFHVMNAGKQIPEPLASELETEGQPQLDRLAQSLELDGVDVVLTVNAASVVPELGIGGYAPTAHLIEIPIDPKHPKLLENWREELVITLAHELHHAKRWRGVGYGKTLLEAMVSEGLAMHFETQITTKVSEYAAPVENMSALWQYAQYELSGPYDFKAWFYGSEDRSIPSWTGYSIGYELVRRFLDQKGGDAAIHANTSAQEFKSAWPANG